jgi:C4-type Zn-finger protein
VYKATTKSLIASSDPVEDIEQGKQQNGTLEIPEVRLQIQNCRRLTGKIPTLLGLLRETHRYLRP